MLTLIAFIVIFSVLILVHEWGHFKAARSGGVKVEEFGFGMPPKAATLYKDKAGTNYTLNWIPFGGFVRLFGEDAHDPETLKDPRSFASKSIGRRAFIIVAGVLMNFALAWLLITIALTAGMRPFLATQADIEKGIAAGLIETRHVLYIHELTENSVLKDSDVKPETAITQVNGKEVTTTEDFVKSLKPNATVNLTVLEGEAQRTVTAKADAEGKLGVTISEQDYITSVKEIQYPIYKAPFYAAKEVVRLSYLTVKMLGDVVVSIVAKFAIPAGVSGPVGIFKMTGHFAQQGIIELLKFASLLSVSLGVINVMPFPALDGGRLLFIVFEILLRRKPNAKMEAIVHATGFALLMILIAIITWNDIRNFF